MKFYLRQLTRLILLATFLTAGQSCNAKKPAELTVSHSMVNVPFQTHNWKVCRENGKILQTNHYRIYTTISNKQNHQVLANFMESCLHNYAKITGLKIPAKRFCMYMFATRAQWKFLTDGMFGKSGPSSKLQSGGYTLHGISVCWDIGDMTTFAIASHEGMHQFLYHNLKTPLPLWADEGLATLCEGCEIKNNKISFDSSDNFVRLPALQNAIDGNNFLPLADFLQTSPEDVIDTGSMDTLEYYSQLYVTMLFISKHKKYSAGLRKMITDAKLGKLRLSKHRVLGKKSCRKGLNAEFIFNHYITDDYKRFNIELKAFANKLIENHLKETSK